LLAEQEAGICAFYVFVAEDNSVLGRFNLVDIENRTAELGYRVAQRVAGRGVATTTVPRAEVLGQVHPRRPGAVLERDRVDHLPVIAPSPAPPRPASLSGPAATARRVPHRASVNDTHQPSIR